MTPQVGDRVVSTYGTGKVVPPIYDLPGAIGVLLDNGMQWTFIDPRVAGVHVIERAHTRYTVAAGGKRASFTVPGRARR